MLDRWTLATATTPHQIPGEHAASRRGETGASTWQQPVAPTADTVLGLRPAGCGAGPHPTQPPALPPGSAAVRLSPAGGPQLPHRKPDPLQPQPPYPIVVLGGTMRLPPSPGSAAAEDLVPRHPVCRRTNGIYTGQSRSSISRPSPSRPRSSSSSPPQQVFFRNNTSTSPQLA
jgi:hypothetical protein